MNLEELASAVYQSPGIAGKRPIADVVGALPSDIAADGAITTGDDCAALPNGDDWLLFAMEGLVNELVREAPWFAGYSGIVVNISDIAAMGGRPTAIVDALWSSSLAHGEAITQGMAEASRAYAVPIVGGHSNTASETEQLAVGILGRAKHLITSFDAQPGDTLVAAIDLRGRYREPWPNWDTSSGQDGETLRSDLAVLPDLAEDGLCHAGKDISMAGVIGTLLMLCECSRVGATLAVADIPRPSEADPVRWLVHTFPSYGFVLAVAPENAAAVRERFEARGIACAIVGECDASQALRVHDGAQSCVARDLNQQPLTGCAPSTT